MFTLKTEEIRGLDEDETGSGSCLLVDFIIIGTEPLSFAATHC